MRQRRILTHKEGQLDSLERKLQIVASAIRGRRNSLQPINRLPTELLCTIFLNTQLNLSSFLPDDTEYNEHGNEWHSLLEVCRHWRGVVARCPLLWCTVDNTIITEKYLRRSQSAALTVYLGIKKPEFDHKALDLLLPHLSRVKELHMAVDGYESTQSVYTHPLLTSPAPALESLSIGTFGKDPVVAGGALPNLFGGHIPRLTKLDLEYFTTLTSTHFPNLTHICLSYQHEGTRQTTSAFLDFLEASGQTLEELALIRAGPTLEETLDIPPAPGRYVELPRLKEMNLGEWPATPLVGRFLSYLVTPGTADLYIWGTMLSDPFADLASVIPEDSSRLTNVQGITKWYLTHFFASQQGELLYTPFMAIVGSSTTGGNGSALHTYGPFQPTRLLETLPRFPLHNVRSFIVRDSSLQTNRFSTSSWKDILIKMGRLEELRILAFQSLGTTRAVLGALMPKEKDREGADTEESFSRTNSKLPSTPSSSSSPVAVVCPQLASIIIEHDADLASIFIAKLVKSRRKLGSTIERLRVLVFDPRGPSPSERPTSAAPPSSPGPSAPALLVPPPPPPPPLAPPHVTAPVPINHVDDQDLAEIEPEDDATYDSEMEFRIRSDEDYELLKACCYDIDGEESESDGAAKKWEVEFVHGTPLSRDLVPVGWPTNVWLRTGGGGGA
ncbi:hypothetical protein VNI00_016078 [Paramarasmius palmivorus]|uniref:F-box domain-containing protein n=1 Tax=Paramarasmius palmivorus TaxID=297713 RepID=A0AAW0BHT9_9AGAR